MKFDPEEIELMKKFKLPYVKPMKKLKEKEYKVLKFKFKCKLCGTTAIKFFGMTRVVGETTWAKDKEVNAPEEWSEEIDITVRTCLACPEVLGRMEKSELVKMLIKTHVFKGKTR